MNNDTINVDISKKWQLLLWKVFLSAAIMFMVVEVIICLVKKDLGMTRGAYMGLYVAIPPSMAWKVYGSARPYPIQWPAPWQL